MKKLRSLVLALMGALACGGAFAQAGPAGLARGQALYEARCDRCHDQSVHGREKRAAKTFADVRAQVARWDRELGALWRNDEIDVVTRYLNHRYYKYPCPREICGAEGAQAQPSGGAQIVAATITPASTSRPQTRTAEAVAATAR